MFFEVLKRQSRSLRLLGGVFAAVLAVSLLLPSGAWAQRSDAELKKLFESKPVEHHRRLGAGRRLRHVLPAGGPVSWPSFCRATHPSSSATFPEPASFAVCAGP